MPATHITIWCLNVMGRRLCVPRTDPGAPPPPPPPPPDEEEDNDDDDEEEEAAAEEEKEEEEDADDDDDKPRRPDLQRRLKRLSAALSGKTASTRPTSTASSVQKDSA